MDNGTETYPLDEAAIMCFAEGMKNIELINAQMAGVLRLFLKQQKLQGNWRLAQNGRELERVGDALDSFPDDAHVGPSSPAARKSSHEASTTGDGKLVGLMTPDDDSSIQVEASIQIEITDASEFHCFRLTLNPRGDPGSDAPRVEIMLHARSLVDLIHKCSLALCDWQAATTAELIGRIMDGLR